MRLVKNIGADGALASLAPAQVQSRVDPVTFRRLQ